MLASCSFEVLACAGGGCAAAAVAVQASTSRFSLVVSACAFGALQLDGAPPAVQSAQPPPAITVGDVMTAAVRVRGSIFTAAATAGHDAIDSFLSLAGDAAVESNLFVLLQPTAGTASPGDRPDQLSDGNVLCSGWPVCRVFKHFVGEYIRGCPMLLKRLECQLSKLVVNSDACARPATGHGRDLLTADESGVACVGANDAAGRRRWRHLRRRQRARARGSAGFQGLRRRNGAAAAERKSCRRVSSVCRQRPDASVALPVHLPRVRQRRRCTACRFRGWIQHCRLSRTRERSDLDERRGAGNQRGRGRSKRQRRANGRRAGHIGLAS